jgi:hypothetical protein
MRRFKKLEHFSIAPMLRNLSLTRISYPISVIIIPWPQLSKLTLDSVKFRAGEFEKILSYVKNLAELWWLGNESSTLEILPSPIFLPNLRVLGIRCLFDDHKSILGAIAAPELQSLHIGHLHAQNYRNQHETESDFCELVVSFLQRGHSLSYFEISINYLSADAIRMLVKHMPLLTTLKLSISKSQGWRFLKEERRRPILQHIEVLDVLGIHLPYLTNFALNPRSVNVLPDVPGDDTLPFPRLRCITVGASDNLPVPEGLQKKLTRLFIKRGITVKFAE